MRRLLPLLVALSLVFSFLGPLSAPPAHAEPDFPIEGGRFYTQASPNGTTGLGFRLTDEGGVSFYTTYTKLGGPSVLGYPISKRFMWQGFVHQAFQKAIFQWQPGRGTGDVAFVNVFDELAKAGKDDWLLATRSTPHIISLGNAEAGQPMAAIMASRLSWLDERPAIKDRFFAVAGAIDPVLLYGLPISKIEDMGTHYAVRLQRAVIQEWKQDTPWAKAGDTTVANGGDIALEAGILPPGASIPESPPQGGDPDLPTLTPEAQKVANAARPAVVKVTLANGDYGSGMIFDSSGLIVTNAHVVAHSKRVQVSMVDGSTFEGQVLGADVIADVALIKVEATDLPTVKLGNSDTVQLGDTVVAIGYTAVVPGAPSARIGVVRDLMGDPSMGGNGLYDVIGSDTFIHPGDSGGPLLNLQGEVVGMNASISFSGDERNMLEASSLSINSVRTTLNRLQ